MTVTVYIVSGSSFCLSAKKMSRNPVNSFLSAFAGWHRRLQITCNTCPYITDFNHAFFISFSKLAAKVKTFFETRACFSNFLSSCPVFSSLIDYL